MATDRLFTHPNFGNEARVEVWGKEVRLIFVASDERRANDLAESFVQQLKAGAVTITMMGKPGKVVEG